MESPSEILRRHGLRPKKSWGQNFLSDDTTLGRIADALHPASGEEVIELGPGLGHLTRALLERGARVVAVERDRDMAHVLREQALEGLRVVEANAAEVRFEKLVERIPTAVVGNLPYHLTSPILFEVLDQHASVSRAVFTVQKEVADRLCAPPGGRAHGVLTVLLDLHFRVEPLFEISRTLFHPPPRVDSAVIRLTAREAPKAEVTDDLRFRRVVKAAFSQRRKTLINALGSDRQLASKEVWLEALERAGIDAKVRAETLSTESFAALERALPR